MNEIKYYPITSLCKEDIMQMLDDREELTEERKKFIEELNDTEMEWIASKLADGFCNCCYWLHLKDRFEQLEQDGGFK